MCLVPLAGCKDSIWNNPYPAERSAANIVYSSFLARPKHLDPVRSYNANEYAFIAQIYEPPLQYHFLKRPYELVPLAATKVPRPRLLGSDGSELSDSAEPDDVALSVYRIELRPGIKYQPHPALATDADGQYRYHSLSETAVSDIHNLADFSEMGSREVTAHDYVYQIKRMADAKNHSPIAGLMKEYIVGLDSLAAQLSRTRKQMPDEHAGDWLDLRAVALEGVRVVDRYSYEITIKGKYPQFVYWLAMPFYAPMPWEADQFYSQPDLIERNITLDWYPIGSGPFMLAENNPNLRMVLRRNPNFRGEPYPEEGMPGDREAGMLNDAGKPMPFIDAAIYSLEKETIPYWNKFLQGFYDTSGISSDSFDQAIQFSAGGDVMLTDEMEEQGINLLTAVNSSIFYFGFNMLDEVVGGKTEAARKLRQAISIAVDVEESISIFQNGRGIAAQSPIAPGIFGFREGQSGMNPYVYDWVGGKPQRKSIELAKQLLTEAGYPGGRNAKTGKPLVLYFDTARTGPDSKSYMDWLRKQFRKIDVELVIRATDYNRFQEKMRKGTAQFYQWGWNADYPDPENFLFLLYGENAKVGKNGENASNYASPEFDQLFARMKNMKNGPDRQVIVDRMIEIVRHDAPWIWGHHPKSYTLFHAWYGNARPNIMANNTLKYKRVDSVLRAELRSLWNQPVVWPVVIVGLVLLLSVIPAVVVWRRREYGVAS